MSTFPKLKRLENFDIPVYRNAHPQRNGKKRYFTHKNFVSSEYALAQDNYSDYLKYNLNIDPSELTSPDFTTQSGWSSRSSIYENKEINNKIPIRSKSTLEKPVKLLELKNSGIQTEIFEESESSSSAEEEIIMRKRPDLYQQKNYKEIPKFSPNIYQNYPQQSRTPLNLTQSQSYRNLPFPVNTNLSSPKNQHIYQSQSYQNLPQNSSNIPLVNPYATPKNINPFIDYSKYLAFQQPIYSKTSPKSYSENPIVGYGREAQNNTPRKMSNYGSMLVKPR